MNPTKEEYNNDYFRENPELKTKVIDRKSLPEGTDTKYNLGAEPKLPTASRLLKSLRELQESGTI